ncbi:MAG TPA: ribosome assembly RNA-binding protein YhbY [Thermoanaerobaculia bacterium]|nr:ribosome assembly RNA-binding protein YhbY [Thermoanaerobaculia bacterium]
MSLSTRQRTHLKALAHPMEPLVRVGRGGVSESVVAEARRTFDSHELIKVRIESDEPAARRALAASLAELAEAELVQTVGKVAILFRAHPDRPRIKLPE